MAVIEKTSARRMADAKAEEKRKKIILAVASVLLVAVLAFQMPRVLKRLHPATTASSSSAQPSEPTSTGAPTSGVTGTVPGAVPSRSPLLKRLKAKDPFQPLIRESAGSPTTSSASVPAAPTAPASKGTSAAGSAPIGFSTQNPIVPSAAAPSPAAAVLWINNHPQIVGLSQLFPAAAPAFRLVSVGPKLVKIRVAGGSFADGRRSITIRRGHGVTLVNTATGVRYDLRFAAPTASTASVTKPASSSSSNGK